jgi:hypothetical protein
MIQPLLIIYLMNFFEPCSTMSIEFACFLAILIVLITLFANFFHHIVCIYFIYILISN